MVCDTPGIEDKKMQTVAQRRCYAVKYIEDRIPPKLWVHAYTDGSAKGATENGGRGVYINAQTHTIAVVTGKYCHNFNAEAAERGHALKSLIEHRLYSKNQAPIVIGCGNSIKESTLK
jgi:hypothetical protein